MSSNNILFILACVIIILSIWILYGSLCEIKMLLLGGEFKDFLQCKNNIK